MQCKLEKGRMCDLKEMFTTMEARQRSFEDRQAKNEIKIANTEKNVALIQKDLSETKAEFLSLTSKVNVNTEQLVDIQSSVKPILEGIYAIKEGMKFWIWVVKSVKWIGITVTGVAASVYAWVEHISQIFKQ